MTFFERPSDFRVNRRLKSDAVAPDRTPPERLIGQQNAPASLFAGAFVASQRARREQDRATPGELDQLKAAAATVTLPDFGAAVTVRTRKAVPPAATRWITSPANR